MGNVAIPHPAPRPPINHKKYNKLKFSISFKLSSAVYAKIVFKSIPKHDRIKKVLAHYDPPVLPMLPPNGILGNDPESAGEATSRAFPKPDRDSQFFIVGPKTVSDANPVAKVSVPTQSA